MIVFATSIAQHAWGDIGMFDFCKGLEPDCSTFHQSCQRILGCAEVSTSTQDMHPFPMSSNSRTESAAHEYIERRISVFILPLFSKDIARDKRGAHPGMGS